MAVSASTQQSLGDGAFRIGEYLVQPELYQVLSPNNRIFLLEPKVMGVLVYLADSAGRAVSKERLLQAVCGDTGASDEVVATAIQRLREVFSDDSPEPRFIQSIPEQGYRLIATLVVEKAETRYQILKKLGQGAMGEVYLAEDSALRRKVALKFVLEERGDSEYWRRRLQREARAAAALDHPFICKVYETGELDGRPYIAMEYVEGQTLRQRLAHGELATKEVLEIAREIAEALEEAHERLIIHRDLKPANIVITPNGHVKVMDFGLAKQLFTKEAAGFDEASTSSTLTPTGRIVGTLAYMAPEQVRGTEPDHRSDIFSLGVVLYEMIAGCTPFIASTANDLIVQILSVEPRPLTQRSPEVPDELQRIVSKALRKDKEERYQSCRDLLVDIKSLKRELEFEEKLARSGHSPKELPAAVITAKPARRMVLPGLSLRWASILLIGAAVVASVWWLSLSGRWDLSDYRPSPSLRQVQLVNWKSDGSDNQSDATFSPDGKMIAFSSSMGTSREIWLKLVGSGEPAPLTKDGRADRTPVWSPDGQQIAYISTQGGHVGVWRIPAIGGLSNSIATLAGTSQRLRRWSKDGGSIYYESGRNLFALNTATGSVTQVTHFDPSSTVTDLNISPREDRVAYVAQTNGKEDVWVMPINGGAALQISIADAPNLNPRWHPDGKRIIYSSSLDGTFQVRGAYLDRRKPLQLTSEENDCLVSDVSSDGSRILIGTERQESDIWGVKVATGEEFAVTSEYGLEFWPDVSPDGQRIAYQVIRSMSQDKLQQCRILARPSQNEGQFVQISADGFDVHWSPDGSKVAFLRARGGKNDIWTARATGGDEKQLTTRGLRFFGFRIFPYNRLRDSTFSWSPDGGKIVYVAADSRGEGIWATSADGSNSARIAAGPTSNASLYSPFWSPDGKSVSYISTARIQGDKSWSLCAARVETGKGELLFQADSAITNLGWLPSGNDLLIAIEERSSGSPSSPTVRLVQVSADNRNNRMIARLESAYIDNIKLSRDGKNIAFVSRLDGRDNLWLMPAIGGQATKVTSNLDARLYFSSLVWSHDGKCIYYGKQLKWSLISMLDNFK
jgi:serine/threonine protein kinase